jgi:hypothetical protein
MSTRKLFPAMALIIVAAACVSGCVALAVGAAGGAAGAVYVKGRLVETVDAPVERVYNATLAMLDAKGLPTLEHKADIASANVRSEYTDDEDIRIEIEGITSEVSEIRIRVGLTGDHDRSVDLLEGIKSRL